jgi:hypothetical protein
MVPLDVIVPPVRPVPAVTLVTLPPAVVQAKSYAAPLAFASTWPVLPPAGSPTPGWPLATVTVTSVPSTSTVAPVMTCTVVMFLPLR